MNREIHPRSAMPRTLQSPATQAQRDYVDGLLLRAREVPEELRKRASSINLTDGDCREVIPALKALQPKTTRYSEEDEDYRSPEGYDYSPDMGVHQFDGGGAWG